MHTSGCVAVSAATELIFKWNFGWGKMAAWKSGLLDHCDCYASAQPLFNLDNAAFNTWQVDNTWHVQPHNFASQV